MIDFKNCTPEELSLAAEAFALTLTKNQDADYINVLGNFVVAVGSIMLTIAAQREFLESLNKKEKQPEKPLNH
ncbi:hypothetical protein [Clostridium polynesiense]|uniref:hypothetical protein n=1 Tax=Clostridium polynesiense TaxID=1325933 RepID=UPI00058F4BB5|nr:hypothetical protein [Clostridium polynesiense]